jgi:hypothetical protein
MASFLRIASDAVLPMVVLTVLMLVYPPAAYGRDASTGPSWKDAAQGERLFGKRGSARFAGVRDCLVRWSEGERE